MSCVAQPVTSRWGKIPDDLWKLILSKYVFELADTFGLKGFVDQESLRQLALFRTIDSYPTLVDIKTSIPESGAREYIALFELSRQARTALLYPMFDMWFATNDDLPTDEIIFFVNHRVRVVQAVPCESEIVLFELDRARCEMLCDVDPRIAKNLLRWDDLESVCRWD